MFENETTETSNTTLATMDDIAVLDHRDAASVYARSGYVPKVPGEVPLSEQLVRAGLDFIVETSPLFHQLNGEMIPAGRHVAVRNAKSGRVFTIAKNGYKPLQWSTMDVLQPVVDAGLGRWDGILALRHGAIGVARVQLNNSIRVPGDSSPLHLFLNVGVPHDKSLRWSAFASTVRPICENTFRMALREANESGYVLKVRHTKSADDKVATAKKVLERSMSQFSCFAAFADRAARTPMSDRQFTTVVEQLLPAKEEVTPQLLKARDKAQELWHGGARGLVGIQGTAWAACNAIGEYADHYTRIRGDASARVDSILFGRANDMKARGVMAIEEVVGELV